MLSVILMLWGASLVLGVNIQSNVTCPASFAWANNKQGLNPCLVAAYATGACYSDVWSVDTLQPDSHYSTYPDSCSCSWAVYNLLGACTACQNDLSSIPTWASIETSSNCSGLISTTTYYPSSVPIPGGTLIPAWAGTNPSAWTNGRFDFQQAEAIANEGLPDLDPTADETTPNKTTPVGAIVGGVIGGVLVLCLGIGGVAWMIIRKRRKARPEIRSPQHMRSISDMSHKTGTSDYGVTLSQSPIFSGRAHSVFGSARGSIFSVSTHEPRIVAPAPAPPAQAIAVLHSVPENDIEPYPLTYQPRSPTSPLHRKASSDTSLQPVQRAEEPVSQTSDTTNSRRRVNPPSYVASISDDASVVASPQTRTHRRDKGSQDTQNSFSVASRSQDAGRPLHSRQTSANTVSTIREDISIA